MQLIFLGTIYIYIYVMLKKTFKTPRGKFHFYIVEGKLIKTCTLQSEFSYGTLIQTYQYIEKEINPTHFG